MSGLDAPGRAAAIAEAGAALRAGRVVVASTDTVYSALFLASPEHAPDIAAGLAPWITDPTQPSPLAWSPRSVEGVAELLGLSAATHRRLLAKLSPGPAIFQMTASPERLAEVGAAIGAAPAALDPAGRGEHAYRRPREGAARELIEGAGAAVLMAEVPAPGGRGGWAVDADEAGAGVRAALGERAQGLVVLDEGRARPGRPATILHLGPGGAWDIRRQGAFEERFVRKQLHRTILFICTGNTCRSPMAEAIATDLLSRHPENTLPTTVISAGTGAFGGAPPSEEAISALEAMGITPDLRGAKALTRQMIAEADAIFAMSRSHLHAVLAFDPTAAGKAALLDPEGGDVPDPIGGPQQVYTETASRIADLVAARLRELDA